MAALQADVESVAAELATSVAYGPRALVLLRSLQRIDVNARLLRTTRLGLVVRQYKSHADPLVACTATELIDAWKEALGFRPGTTLQSSASAADSTKPSAAIHRPTAAQPADLDDALGSALSSTNMSHKASSSSSAPTNSAKQVHSENSSAASEDRESARNEARNDEGWVASESMQSFRNEVEKFKKFTLQQPFHCQGLVAQVRIAAKYYHEECPAFLDGMAREFGAIRTSRPPASSEEEQLLNRLSRLEERFRGSGVTEGEARNAMRLFERELSKANWTAEKFAQLKRQQEGMEECSMADEVVEGSLYFESSKRQAWFASLGERVAAPLGLQHGLCSGGCCFVGPLAAVAGALLTAALVCHLARLDLDRASEQRKKSSRLSAPQFLQGFVDGALEPSRHLVWQQIFSIEDEDEASKYCRQMLEAGFFQDSSASVAVGQTRSSCSHQAPPESGHQPRSRAPRQSQTGDNSWSEDHVAGGHGPSNAEADQDDLQSILRHLFGAGTGGSRGGASGSTADATQGPTGPQSAQPAVFQGKGHRLSEDDDKDDDQAAESATSSGRMSAEQGWALTFASNLQLARKSHQKSQADARKVYHWQTTTRAAAVTRIGTESYEVGRTAGAKRKGEIDSASGRAKGKCSKSTRLSLTSG